jgi:hypothetical protein
MDVVHRLFLVDDRHEADNVRSLRPAARSTEAKVVSAAGSV